MSSSIEEYAVKLKDLKDKVYTPLNDRMEDVETLVQDIPSDIGQYVTRLNNLELSLDGINSQLSTHTLQISTLDTTTSDLTTRVTTLENTIGTLSTILDSLVSTD